MARVVLFISAVGLIVAAVAAGAGVASMALALAVEGADDLAATLGVVSIVCAIAAVVLGIVGWRWAERRREVSILGQAAGLIGATTLLAWFAVLFYALSQDTP